MLTPSVFNASVCLCWRVMCLFVLFGFGPNLASAETIAAATYENGCTGVDGTSLPGASPCAEIDIATLAQLRRLSERSQDWGGTISLTADIDATDTSSWNVGDHDNDTDTANQAMGFSPIGNGTDQFQGTFNGEDPTKGITQIITQDGQGRH